MGNGSALLSVSRTYQTCMYWVIFSSGAPASWQLPILAVETTLLITMFSILCRILVLVHCFLTCISYLSVLRLCQCSH